MTLLQDKSVRAAAVVCSNTILTQLVTDSPNLTVIVVWATEQTSNRSGTEIKIKIIFNLKPKQALTCAGAAVICHYKTIGTVARASLRRRVTKELTAQGGATIQTYKNREIKKKNTSAQSGKITTIKSFHRTIKGHQNRSVAISPCVTKQKS